MIVGEPVPARVLDEIPIPEKEPETLIQRCIKHLNKTTPLWEND